MSLVSGQRVGSYEIVAPLGSGGMGDVYRARDTKLQRDVAIKVLRDAIVTDPDRLVRFEREAQVLASLNHPNIAQIYGVEEHLISTPAGARPGQPEAPALALVMELVEGQTLDTLVRPSGLPCDVALPIARQIAEALEAAHEQGIIHRDLKPSNVKVRADGTVKVLDFGLAKAVDPASSGASAHIESTTMASPAMTAQGLILGTAAYMSPEQARGKVVDRRTDIWAFGCVLFEMLTGQVLFAGETVSDVLASILAREPNLAALPPGTTPPLRALLGHCLARDPRRRLRDIGDARLALDDVALGGGATESGLTTVPTRSVRSTMRIAMVAAIAAAAMTAVGAGFALRPSSPIVWSGVRLGGPTQAFGVRLSPDGQLLAFLTFVDQLPQLAVMKPDAHSWTVLTHDREHGYITAVSWAPDGSRIYFDRIWGQPLGVFWVPPLGGEVRPILDDAFGPEVLPDGSLVVLKLTSQGDEEVFHFWPDSGRLEPLPVFMAQTDVAPMLRAFPDGKAFVFYGTSERERSRASRLLVYDFVSRTTRELAAGGRQPSASNWAPLDVSPDGRSVYFLSEGGDTDLLTEVPSQSGTPRTLFSFPNSAAPVTIDVAGDGSFYLDQLVMPTSLLRVASVGGAPESTFLFTSAEHAEALPSGDTALEVFTAGKIHVAFQGFGTEPRVLVDTTEETKLPVTVFGGQVALMMGSGDQARLALASVRDGHILRRYSGRADTGLAASPDGKTLYYSFAGSIWAQPVVGGTPARLTEGTDVTADPSGRYLYLKRSRAGVLSVVRFHLGDGTVDDLLIPARYHVGMPPLAPAAVDGHGRLLVTVVSKDSFYYQTAMLDPTTKAFTLIPIAIDGDKATAGWAPDGRVIAEGRQYLMSLWHYEPSKALK